jgi:hypothetical protein
MTGPNDVWRAPAKPSSFMGPSSLAAFRPHQALQLSGDRRVRIGQDRIRFLFTMLDNPPNFLE